MNDEAYWRNIIANEIAGERDKIKAYYQSRFPNGMEQEHFVRLNIFSLCESIARAKSGDSDG